MLDSVVQPTIDNGKDRNDTIELLVNSNSSQASGNISSSSQRFSLSNLMVDNH